MLGGEGLFRLANPSPPGQPMGKLLKLPVFAQYILILINSVEARWFQAALPDVPLAINVYASLTQADLPATSPGTGDWHVGGRRDGAQQRLQAR